MKENRVNSDDDYRPEGKPVEWCEERGETIAHDIDEEEFTVLHLCRHNAGHDGPHRCWFCSQNWDGQEVPC
jgi:hypothetical protein